MDFNTKLTRHVGIEYQSVKLSNLLFASQHFHDHMLVEHDVEPSHTPHESAHGGLRYGLIENSVNWPGTRPNYTDFNWTN